MQSPISASGVIDGEFNVVLDEFLANLSKRFPDRDGIKQAAAMNTLFNDTAMQKEKRSTWAIFSLPILPAIMSETAYIVSAAFAHESIANPLLSRIGIDTIISDTGMDVATKQSVWKYLQLLTVIAHQGTSVVIPDATTPAPESVFSHPSPVPSVTPVAVPVTAPVVVPSAAPDFAKIAEGFAESLPKVMEAFSKVIEKDGGNNMLAQMMKQYMNPNQLQPGFLNNVAANMMQSDIDPGVMGAIQQEMKGMSVEDIMSKLQKLERLEKAHNKRRQMKH